MSPSANYISKEVAGTNDRPMATADLIKLMQEASPDRGNHEEIEGYLKMGMSQS
jgi:hypothetical protein